MSLVLKGSLLPVTALEFASVGDEEFLLAGIDYNFKGSFLKSVFFDLRGGSQFEDIF